MTDHTRRQFIGTTGSAAVAAMVVPGALAAGRAAPAHAQAPPASPPTPSAFAAYQSEIYLRGTTANTTPKITTNLSRLEAEAAEVLSRRAERHLLASAGGAAAARANARAFSRWQIVPRMFIDRAERYLSTTILGTRMPAPVVLAPVGRQKLAHPDGEDASARAAAAIGLTYIHARQASSSIEAVAAASGAGPRWYQLDWPDDGDVDVAALRRARTAGFTHLVLTAPRPGESWRPLQRIRRSWDDPILLHGVRTVADARAAARRRFDGIVVSNHHRGRGDAPSGSVDALPRIADAVGTRLAVLFDSGVRTGTEAYKALALGADAVLVGRPYVYGLALDGEAGVTHVLKTLLAELDLTLANAGFDTHRKLSRASLARGD